jgi:hypothetical protein
MMITWKDLWAEFAAVVTPFFPIVGVSGGFFLGFSILSMVLRRIFDYDPAWDGPSHSEPLRWADTGQPVSQALDRFESETEPEPELRSDHTCRYCGQDYEGKLCPHCGGPKQ